MTRLLLVELDERALEATAATLWRHRDSFRICTSSSEAEALELARAHSPDVIVSGERLAEGDGFGLLEQVARDRPDVVRVLICDAARASGSLGRAMAVAHRCLYRPWRPQRFIQMLGRLERLRELVGLQTCQELVVRDGEIPPLPHVYTQLVGQLSRGDVDLDRVADLISADVALTSSLLRVINSALFNLPREILSVREAVVYLGVKIVRSLVLSEETLQLVEQLYELPSPQARRLHQRASQVAASARRLTRCADPAQSDAAFLAGLLHVIGGFVGAQGDYPPRVRAALGGYLLGLWGIQESIVTAVARYLDPEPDELGDPVLAALFLAHQFEELNISQMMIAARDEPTWRRAMEALELTYQDMSRLRIDRPLTTIRST